MGELHWPLLCLKAGKCMSYEGAGGKCSVVPYHHLVTRTFSSYLCTFPQQFVWVWIMLGLEDLSQGSPTRCLREPWHPPRASKCTCVLASRRASAEMQPTSSVIQIFGSISAAMPIDAATCWWMLVRRHGHPWRRKRLGTTALSI